MKNQKLLQKNLFGTLLLALLFVFASCEKDPVSEDLNAIDANANASPAAQQGESTIAEIVIASATADEDAQFTLLLEALVATDLAGVFAGEDNYTVFAPTDQAFRDALGDDVSFENIDEETKAFLTNVLLYHVTDGRRFSNSVVPKNNPKDIETLLGPSFYVYSPDADGNIGIDTNDEDMDADATILSADMPATNGVIHVIDAVLLPAE